MRMNDDDMAKVPFAYLSFLIKIAMIQNDINNNIKKKKKKKNRSMLNFPIRFPLIKKEERTFWISGERW